MYSIDVQDFNDEIGDNRLHTAMRKVYGTVLSIRNDQVYLTLLPI